MTHENSRLTQERLKELLHYDPETGVMVWVRDRSIHAHAGSEAGTIGTGGYRQVKVDGKIYQRSRLAWLYMTGAFPPEFLDHKNGVRDDDRLENLRPCAVGENNQNLGLTKANKSGVMGVSWKTSHGRWCAQIKHLGKVYYLGLFDSLVDAAEARKTAKAAMHTFNPVDPTRRGVAV